MPVATGIIVLAQESRFRLVDDEGRGRMFILSRKAGVEPQDLPHLQRGQTRVRVVYDDAPNLVAALAREIYAQGNASGERA